MTISLQVKHHILSSPNAATYASHIVSAPALSRFDEVTIKTLRPTEGFSRYECNGDSPSADWSC
jgi:hypothetical protein